MKPDYTRGPFILDLPYWSSESHPPFTNWNELLPLASMVRVDDPDMLSSSSTLTLLEDLYRIYGIRVLLDLGIVGRPSRTISYLHKQAMSLHIGAVTCQLNGTDSEYLKAFSSMSNPSIPVWGVYGDRSTTFYNDEWHTYAAEQCEHYGFYGLIVHRHDFDVDELNGLQLIRSGVVETDKSLSKKFHEYAYPIDLGSALMSSDYVILEEAMHSVSTQFLRDQLPLSRRIESSESYNIDLLSYYVDALLRRRMSVSIPFAKDSGTIFYQADSDIPLAVAVQRLLLSIGRGSWNLQRMPVSIEQLNSIFVSSRISPDTPFRSLTAVSAIVCLTSTDLPTVVRNIPILNIF